jgi:putative ABC transport system permease protein
MTLVALKGLLAHKVRVAMTALSIALGVAFVAGTLVLTDSLTSSFSQSFRHQYEGVDVTVRSAASYEDGGVGDQRLPVSADLLEEVRDLPDVATAEGSVTGYALMLDGDGDTVGAGAQSNNGMSAPTSSIGGAVTYRSGRAPSSAEEVAVDAGSADQASLEVGDRIRVLFLGPPREFTVVGIARFGDQDRLGSTTTALFDLATAQDVLGEAGTFDEIRVAAAAGVPDDELRDRIAGALPAGVEATTGKAVADERAAALEDDLGFISTFLLVFAGIAVFVGSFIIWNTFSILVAQRTRELALLRAIGATRRQVRRSVLVEAAAVGVVGSLAGLGLGVGLARLLVLLLGQTGVEMTAPSVGDLSARAVITSMAVGVVITVLAAVAPASRATRVAPVEALRDSVPGDVPVLAAARRDRRCRPRGGRRCPRRGSVRRCGHRAVAVGVLVSFLGITTLLPLLSRVLARTSRGAAAAHRRHDRPARQGQRDAQPQAHGRDGRRADDRAGDGREHHRAGAVAEDQHRLRRRPHHHERAGAAGGWAGRAHPRRGACRPRHRRRARRLRGRVGGDEGRRRRDRRGAGRPRDHRRGRRPRRG